MLGKKNPQKTCQLSMVFVCVYTEGEVILSGF